MRTGTYRKRLDAFEKITRKGVERWFQVSDPGSEDPEQRERARNDYRDALRWELGGPNRRAHLFEVEYVAPEDTAEDMERYKERKTALLAEVRQELNAPERAPLQPPTLFRFVDPESKNAD